MSELKNYKSFKDNANKKEWYYYEVIEATNEHEYTGKRPNEQWTSNKIPGFFYDVEYYEKP